MPGPFAYMGPYLLTKARNEHVRASSMPGGFDLHQRYLQQSFTYGSTSNHSITQASGYGDLTHLQGQLASQGSAAAKPYPKLDRMHECHIVDKEL